MNKKIGKVIEVFIPDTYKNNKLLDINDRDEIGFKIMTDNKIIETIEEQTDINTTIMKDDYVLITNQIINNKEYIDIEPYEGEIYE